MRQHPLVRPRGDVITHPTRGTCRVLRAAGDVNAWRAFPPAVDAVRPTHCPGCGAASRVLGESLTLHGHGRRTRQVRGPLDADGDPRERVVLVRRYRCTRCRTVVTVVPCDVLPRRHYGAAAIALAFALFGVLGLSAALVRRAISTWRIVGVAARGWRSLAAWIDAAVDGTLWKDARAGPPGATRRAHAHRLAMSLAGHAPSATGGTFAHQACVGAARCT